LLWALHIVIKQQFFYIYNVRSKLTGITAVRPNMNITAVEIYLQ